MYYRICIIILNFIFPPLAILLLKGVHDPQTILNAILFILAIIPSYIHGFYIISKHFRDEDDREIRRKQQRRRREGGSMVSSRHRSRSRSRSRSLNRSHSISTRTSSTYSNSGSNASLFREQGPGRRRGAPAPAPTRRPRPQPRPREREREQEVWYGEVEEREEEEGERDMTGNLWHGQPYHTTTPRYITWRGAGQDGVPPPCPDPPSRDERFLE